MLQQTLNSSSVTKLTNCSPTCSHSNLTVIKSPLKAAKCKGHWPKLSFCFGLNPEYTRSLVSSHLPKKCYYKFFAISHIFLGTALKSNFTTLSSVYILLKQQWLTNNNQWHPFGSTARNSVGNKKIRICLPNRSFVFYVFCISHNQILSFKNEQTAQQKIRNG